MHWLSLTLYEPQAALVHQLLAIGDLWFKIVELVVLCPVARLQILQSLDLVELFLTDDDVSVLIQDRAWKQSEGKKISVKWSLFWFFSYFGDLQLQPPDCKSHLNTKGNLTVSTKMFQTPMQTVRGQ